MKQIFDMDVYTFIITDKGEFFVRNYFDCDPDDSGISIYDENGDHITQISGPHLDGTDPESIEVIKGIIETNDEV